MCARAGQLERAREFLERAEYGAGRWPNLSHELGGDAEAARAARSEDCTNNPNDPGGLEMSVVAETTRNGVDAEKLFATLDLISAQPELARFQFRAGNRWIEGAHNRSTIKGFYAAGGEDASRAEAFEIDAGEPAILLGTDTGANPAEFLLHALAACLTTSIVYVAAARKVKLASVESILTGDMDVRGALGVDDERIGDPAMPIELTAHTGPGECLVAIAEQLTELLAARAGEHDRDGTYPFEAIDALKAAGYFAAPVAVELGGLGVSCAHDLVVASSRLARGDASVAIGVNMHLVAVLNMERRRQVALAAGAERRARGFASSLARIARDGVVLAAAISEPGQDLTRPGTSATRTESGWRIDGRKLFCTMSPAATDLYVAVTYADGDGVERYAYAIVPIDAPGVVVNDDWDALGMRASGSNSISLEGVELPEPALLLDRSTPRGLPRSGTAIYGCPQTAGSPP